MVRDSKIIAGLTDGAARQGLYGGLLLGAFEMAVLFVANVVLPPTAERWTDSNPVGVALLVLYAVVFMVIGVRGRQRAETNSPGARAGAVAGFVVAVAFLVTFFILDNVFYARIIQEPSKVGATHASLNGTLLGAAFLMPVLVTAIAALLGEWGGSFAVGRRASRPGPVR
jgi:hypothetical protein